MADVQHLRNAPIVEALVDVRVAARPEFTAERFLSLHDELRGEFPKLEERRAVSFEVAFGGPEPGQRAVEHGINGVFFRSADEKEIAQFRVDGFTLNRLAPYSSWRELLPRALHLLDLYFKVAQPRSVTRVATRYINRLELPFAQLELFLTQPPRTIPGTGSAVIASVETMTAAPESSSAVNFTQALDRSEGKIPAVLLDIDAFRSEEIGPTIAEIETRLQVLHEIKNRVFFGAITDLALRFYK